MLKSLNLAENKFLERIDVQNVKMLDKNYGN